MSELKNAAPNWLQDGALLYVLRNGKNCYEVNVAQVAGSRDMEVRSKFAVGLRELLEHGFDAESAALALPDAQPAEFDDWPEFSQSGMGCGLEDRGITDRYEAMQYGWNEALEQVGQRLNGYNTTPQPAIEPEPVGGNCSPEGLVRQSRISEKRALRMLGNEADVHAETMALLKALVDQIEACKPVDSVGHDFLMNQAYIGAKNHV